MNEILIMIGLIILLVLAILLSIVIKMAKNSNQSKKTNTKKESKPITIDTLELPVKIMKIQGSSLRNACKTVFDSYRACGYKDKDPEASSKSEWHSWQVSMLLAYLKGQKQFPPVNPREVFEEEVLNMSRNDLKEALNLIYVKYNSNVNIQLDRDSLSKDNIWTAREVAIILYSIIMQKYN